MTFRVHTGGMQARSVSLRVALVALLAFGLVGMHHLVVAACHHVYGHSGHVATVAAPAALDHSETGSVVPAPLQGPQDVPEAPGGLVGAAATCLAILLMVMSLVLPRVVGRVRRWSLPRLEPSTPARMQTIHRRPDLAVLSISRT